MSVRIGSSSLDTGAGSEPPRVGVLERLFHLRALGTRPQTELLAGLTTFLGMAYILMVNPVMLAEAGLDQGAAFAATCVAATIGSVAMGLLANYPIAQAPGMGLNAYFTYGVVLGMGHSWQVALGAVFLSGCAFFLLSLLGVRAWIVAAIPRSLKLAISAGIGLFLGIIALKNAGIITAHPQTLVTLGSVTDPRALLAAGGFVVMVGLERRGVPGAIVLTILAVTGLSALLGLSSVSGVVSAPPSLLPTLLQLDIAGALGIGGVTIVFTFLFVDLFDTAGTLIGVAHRAGMLDEEGRLPRIGRAFVADSVATIAGATLGTSTTTSYIESALGVQAGGRSGLTAVTVGALFLLSLFFAPLAAAVPPWATAPALLYLAVIMSRGLAELDWEELTESAPAVVAALAMPLTFSIATGIGLGFLAYVGVKLASGRWRELNVGVVVIAALFAVKFAL